MGQGNLQLFDVGGGGHLFPQPAQQGFAHPSRRQITEEGLADPVTQGEGQPLLILANR
jgi:hypothetical protein